MRPEADSVSGCRPPTGGTRLARRVTAWCVARFTRPRRGNVRPRLALWSCEAFVLCRLKQQVIRNAKSMFRVIASALQHKLPRRANNATAPWAVSFRLTVDVVAVTLETAVWAVWIDFVFHHLTPVGIKSMAR